MSRCGALLEKVRNLRDFMVKVLCELVAIPTVVPPGEHYLDCCTYLRDLLRDMGLSVEVIEVPREYVPEEYRDYPRYIVYARSSKDPVIHFNGHYDVVPPGSGWVVTDPFKPKVVDGRVYGRGAVDMKGGIAAIIGAVKALLESGIEDYVGFELSFTPDEEIGGRAGVGYLVKSGRVRSRFCIVAEPSNLDQVWIGHKGLVWFEVTVIGKSAHGSTPWLGVNAFECMVELVHRLLREYRPLIESRVTRFETIPPEGRRATAMFGGVVRGGVKVNVVPDTCSFTVDRRVIPEENIDGVKHEFTEFVLKIAKELKCDVKIKILEEMKPCIVSESSRLLTTLKNVAKHAIGVEPKETLCIGGLDMRYFIEAGIDTLTYGPGPTEAAHRPDEYIDIESMVKAAQVYAALCTRGELLQ